MINVDDFCVESECIYKEEKYFVRDNGAVLRLPRDAQRHRPTDNQWTFGKLNYKTGYMEIASVRVHRIVATAFHGMPPTKEYVVDHIDTNKQNNRPENLRWVTRLENVLLNPITAKRIALTCGSVEAFLADPSQFREKFHEQSFMWMRTVSKEEAKTSLERMLAWAKDNKRPSGGSLDEWIFDRENPKYLPNLYVKSQELTRAKATMATAQSTINLSHLPVDLVMAKTPGAAQRDWRTPSEFPCCPQEYDEEPIAAYSERLKTGSVFCHNDFGTSLVIKSVTSNDHQSLYVMSESLEENAIKPWSLAQITYESDLFVHTSLHSFFTQEGAEKQFCLAQGLEWTGEDTIDDYC